MNIFPITWVCQQIRFRITINQPKYYEKPLVPFSCSLFVASPDFPKWQGRLLLWLGVLFFIVLQFTLQALNDYVGPVVHGRDGLVQFAVECIFFLFG